jgi:hypothetical protein
LLLFSQYAKWVAENGFLDTVSELLISSLRESLLQESAIESARDWKDFGISPTTAAAQAIEKLLISFPQSFLHDERLGPITGMLCNVFSCLELQSLMIRLT